MQSLCGDTVINLSTDFTLWDITCRVIFPERDGERERVRNTDRDGRERGNRMGGR